MHTSTLRKVGGSTMLAVPPAMLDTLDLKAGATVGIAIEDGHLVIDPIPRPNYTLDELLAMSTDTPARESATPEEREWLNAPATGDELL
ncbi:MAG: antitoxin [Magnetococcales bacterium]|nr:antitoxin [Magnetococcales bacterium]